MYLITGYTLKEIGLPNIAETQPSDCCEDREFETEYAQTNEPKLYEMQRYIFDIVFWKYRLASHHNAEHIL